MATRRTACRSKLLGLVRLGDAAYGVSIHNEIRRRARREVTIAAVYKTLERLENKGLAVSVVGEMNPAVLTALVERMSPQEVINNLGVLRRHGGLDHAEVIAAGAEAAGRIGALLASILPQVVPA